MTKMMPIPNLATATPDKMVAWHAQNAGKWNKDQRHVGEQVIPFYNLYTADKLVKQDPNIINQIKLWDNEVAWAMDHMGKLETEFSPRAWPFGFDVPTVATKWNKDKRDQAAEAAEKSTDSANVDDKSDMEKGGDMLKKYGIYAAVGVALVAVFFFLK